MIKGTEINIEIADDGSWTATSSTYPGWKMSGSDSVASAEIAVKDLELWVEEHTCPICGEYYPEPPAISRIDNRTRICSFCGIRQSLEPLSNIIPADQVEELVARNKEMYRNGN